MHLRSNSKKSLSKNYSREDYLKYEDRNQLNTFETQYLRRNGNDRSRKSLNQDQNVVDFLNGYNPINSGLKGRKRTIIDKITTRKHSVRKTASYLQLKKSISPSSSKDRLASEHTKSGIMLPNIMS